MSYVLFRDDCYFLNPHYPTWIDYEAFSQHCLSGRRQEREGDRAGAMRAYLAAESLYQGELFLEDRYEDWLTPLRQNLQDQYLGVLDRLYEIQQEDISACTTLCSKMLAVDPSHESAHRRLMRCYSRLGQPYLALRQFNTCVEVLDRELGVGPSQETLKLQKQILHGEFV